MPLTSLLPNLLLMLTLVMQPLLTPMRQPTTLTTQPMDRMLTQMMRGPLRMNRKLRRTQSSLDRRTAAKSR